MTVYFFQAVHIGIHIKPNVLCAKNAEKTLEKGEQGLAFFSLLYQ